MSTIQPVRRALAAALFSREVGEPVLQTAEFVRVRAVGK